MRRLRSPLLVLSLVPLAAAAASGADFAFSLTYVDESYGGNGRPGWVRSGDMDGDGDLDLVAGGGFALFIYENDGGGGGWLRHGSLDGSAMIGANAGELFDVDRDGDLDVVSARFYGDLGWWENPGGPLAADPWTFHRLGAASWYLHDLIRADVDGDGAVEEIVANLISGGVEADVRIEWLKPGTDPTAPWQSNVIEPGRDDGRNNHAGLDVGDVDRDGRRDLAYSNGWYQAPPDPTGGWTWRPVTDIYGISNALLRDLDGDGGLDLVMSAGHHGSGVYWFESPADPIADGWVQHTVGGSVLQPECLSVLDLDRDGDPDIVTCDLDFDRWDQEVHNVYVFENLGDGLSWREQNVAPNTYPSHLLQTVDLDRDGRVDVISEATGYSVISYYRNVSAVGWSTTLFGDEFEDGSPPVGWSFERGTWSEALGRLKGIPDAAAGAKIKARAIAEPIFAGCGECTVRAELESRSAFGAPAKIHTRLLAWYQNRRSNLSLTLKPAQDKIILRQKQDRTVLGKITVAAAVDPNVIYRLELRHESGRFTVLLDDSLILDAPSLFASPPLGTVGVQSRNSDLLLHRIEVTD